MATASFSVTSSQHTLELDGQGQGEAVFTVTNTTDLPKRAQLKVYAQDGTNTSWLALDGDPARDFTPKGTQQVSVTVKVPQGTLPGSHTFRLHAISTSNPQEDYTEGPWITMAVLKTGEVPKKPVRMGLIIGLVVAAVVVIGGVIGYVVCCTGDAPPVEKVVEQVMVEVKDVSLMSLKDVQAQEMLEGLRVTIIDKPTAEKEDGIVLSQSLNPGTPVAKDTAIQIEVARPLVVQGDWPAPVNNWYYHFDQNGPEVEIKEYTFLKGTKTLQEVKGGMIKKNILTVDELFGEITADEEGIATSIRWNNGITTTKVRKIPDSWVTIAGIWGMVKDDGNIGRIRAEFKPTNTAGNFEMWNWMEKENTIPAKTKGDDDVQLRGLEIFQIEKNRLSGVIDESTINVKGEAQIINKDIKVGDQVATMTLKKIS